MLEPSNGARPSPEPENGPPSAVSADARDPAAASSAKASDTVSRPAPPRRSWRMYVVGAVVIIILGILAGTFLFMNHSGTSSASEVLVSAGTYYTLPSGQFNSIDVIVKSPSIINGTIANSFGIALYLMTPSQLSAMAKTGNLSGYEWTSGRLANNTVYDLDLTIQPGAWEIVFLNPNTSPLIANTAYGFYTPLTLTSE